MQKEQLEISGKKTLVIYIYNMTEDEWSFISAVGNRTQRQDLLEGCENAADCYFLGAGTTADLIYVTPKKISPSFIAYAKSLMGYKNVKTITPKNATHQTTDDLIHDETSLTEIISLARPYEQVILKSYATTPNIYALKNILSSAGLKVDTPELPEPQNAWTVNFYGSKSGIRQLASLGAREEPDLVMPDGLICVGKSDAAKIAANRYLKQKGVVIKTNKGSGGSGLFIFREGDLPTDYQACEKAILEKMNGDPYWDIYPIIIEDLVITNMNNTAFPNTEFKIHKNGRIELVYICTLAVTKDGQFLGVDINDHVVNERLVARIVDTGYYIAEKYAAAGYRGHFDVDMMVGKNGQVYVSETNLRNTGGTDVYRIAKMLLGRDFLEDYFIISRSNYDVLKNKKLTFDQAIAILKPYLYNPKTKTGLIISSENSLKNNKFIYQIISKNKPQAYKLETEVLQLLSTL